MSLTPVSCSSCRLTVVTTIGTSWRFCVRFWAVTTMVSTVCGVPLSLLAALAADCEEAPVCDAAEPPPLWALAPEAAASSTTADAVVKSMALERIGLIFPVRDPAWLREGVRVILRRCDPGRWSDMPPS